MTSGRWPILGVAGVLAACTPATLQEVSRADAARARLAPPPGATYDGIETRLLDGDLVGFTVRMSGARAAADVTEYADCAAAQYALIRGYGFARHLRTNVDEEGGHWQADAIYTISAALPDGLIKIDAEVAVASCTERGIPTV